MKAVIFLGPSLPLTEARNTLDAIYLPPAQQTDLITAAVNHRPDAIGLIDGVFLQSLSVWHKEILFVLERGIPIYGASSMGALRAAETAAFGMVGVGEIFRQYASGELTDDDEVALVHAAAEQGYVKASEPMVNIRATYEAAARAGLITEPQRARLVAIGKGLFFPERTFHRIHELAAAEGMDSARLQLLSTFVSTNYVDLKQQDALELLKTIRNLDAAAKPRKTPPSFVPRHSTAFETLYNRDRRVVCGETELALETISNYVALHDPDFDDLNFATLNGVLTFTFSQLLGIEPSEESIVVELNRFRKRRNLQDEETLDAWLTENHLSLEELRHLMSQRAACRALHRWSIIAMWMGRTTKPILDELRIRGTYRHWAERAAAQERLLGASGHFDTDGAGTTSKTLQEFVDEHCQWTECRIDIDPHAWSEEVGFHADSNFKMELSRAAAARRALLELLGDPQDVA